MIIPDGLARSCRGGPQRAAWLTALPDTIAAIAERWQLTLGGPWTGDATCAWVATAVRVDGSRAVLKIGMPHLEGDHEIEGLQFWDGDPTIRLIDADRDLNAMLFERCEPGTSLRERPEPEQDAVIAGLLRRLWRRPSPLHPFRPLSTMISAWVDETRAAEAAWPDAGLVRAGIQAFQELSAPAPDDVLLATDLHAGNVLRAQREPWLAIDPKPFVGDRAYDGTQHLVNCEARILADPRGTIERVAGLLEVDGQRLRRWMFARVAAEPRAHWTPGSLGLARLLD